MICEEAQKRNGKVRYPMRVLGIDRHYVCVRYDVVVTEVEGDKRVWGKVIPWTRELGLFRRTSHAMKRDQVMISDAMLGEVKCNASERRGIAWRRGPNLRTEDVPH